VHPAAGRLAGRERRGARGDRTVQARALYIASELGWPAVEAAPRRLFASATHIIEVLRDGKPAAPGEIGNVVVTRTTHGSPILLRYDTRDLARRNEDGVSMSRILGRPNTGVIHCPDGAEIGSDRLDATVAEVAAGAMGYYRLTQRRSAPSTRFLLECCPSGEGDFERALAAMGEALRELLGTSVDVRKTNGIPPHRGGRMPLYVDERE
jgi:phenylacetate-coenzyme A ligase PaaK-like adenylate-forming protein